MPDQTLMDWDNPNKIPQLMAQLPLFQVPIVPMPGTVFQNQDWDTYERLVDQFIQGNKMKPNDTFRVDHPEGPTHYRYLGPNSGGRKDWMQIDSNPNVTS